MRRWTFTFIIIGCLSTSIWSQDHSVARDWNEIILTGIRNDFARPTVHARNLWHSSIMMYDIWTIINDEVAKPYFVGETIGEFECPFLGFPTQVDKEESIRIAICHALYNFINIRFRGAPGFFDEIRPAIRQKMLDEGLNINDSATFYQDGDPAALGNYIAQQIIQFGRQDNSNEQIDYGNQYYEPVNEPLVMALPGNPDISDPNRWQPLSLEFNKDQSCNIIPGETLPFLSPEWGNVLPFSLEASDCDIFERDNEEYKVYHDPGAPPYVDTTMSTPMSQEYLWGFSLVSAWSSHLDPSDEVMWDISPGNLGNLPELPESIEAYRDYYDLIEGGDPSAGHNINPHTGMPYQPNIVPRGDYARVLAEFWADGPDSETPPGHWFTILNYVMDQPEFVRSYRGLTDPLNTIEWDVKAYFMLGGAMHDCAISAWGIKGWYDYIRPVSAIRAMAQRGQSTVTTLQNYHPAGIPLIPDLIDVVTTGDDLAGNQGENLGKIKVKAWRGPDYIDNPETDIARVGWILAEEWWPYQRPSFVTPPFAGFVSGHSTYSRAAAEILTSITGDPYFPGGMGEFIAEKDSFLVFEDGPSVDVILQWATYRDASDQTSLSRIWGGIHPPADDIPGRKIGIKIAESSLTLAEKYFFVDEDADGFYNYIDCNDNDASINPDMEEVCDGIDNNCSGAIDENLALFTYYFDNDQDGFGNIALPVDTCRSMPIAGYVTNSLDCNDNDPLINPDIPETCDGIDNNCSGVIDENLTLFTYYFDNDQDGFGNLALPVDTCRSMPIAGYVANSLDCNDNDPMINPTISETCDGIDNNCTGVIDENLTLFRYYRDEDGDGYGNLAIPVDTCRAEPIQGFVRDSTDCNDAVASINPGEADIPDNQIDEDCSGYDLYKQSKVFPNPFHHSITVHFDAEDEVKLQIFDAKGRKIVDQPKPIFANFFNVELSSVDAGIYFLRIIDENDEYLYSETIVKQ